MTQPINYRDHDVDYAFKILQSNKPYSVQSLSNVVIKFKQDVFVTDKLTFDFIKFSSDFIEKYPEITHVADLGTGSGVIGVTLAKLHPSKDFVALDISTQALELAKLNAQTNRVANIRASHTSGSLKTTMGRLTLLFLTRHLSVAKNGVTLNCLLIFLTVKTSH